MPNILHRFLYFFQSAEKRPSHVTSMEITAQRVMTPFFNNTKPGILNSTLSFVNKIFKSCFHSWADSRDVSVLFNKKEGGEDVHDYLHSTPKIETSIGHIHAEYPVLIDSSDVEDFITTVNKCGESKNLTADAFFPEDSAKLTAAAYQEDDRDDSDEIYVASNDFETQTKLRNLNLTRETYGKYIVDHHTTTLMKYPQLQLDTSSNPDVSNSTQSFLTGSLALGACVGLYLYKHGLFNCKKRKANPPREYIKNTHSM